MDKIKEITISIIDEFEQLLEEKDITIPDDCREGDESESRLFGDTYYRLEDSIYKKIYNNFIICPIEFKQGEKDNEFKNKN